MTSGHYLPYNYADLSRMHEEATAVLQGLFLLCTEMVGTLDQHLHAVDRDDAHPEQADGSQLQRDNFMLAELQTDARSEEDDSATTEVSAAALRDNSAASLIQRNIIKQPRLVLFK